MKIRVNGITFRGRCPASLAIPFAIRHWGRIARTAGVPSVREMEADWETLTEGWVEDAWKTTDVTADIADTNAVFRKDYVTAQITALVTVVK